MRNIGTACLIAIMRNVGVDTGAGRLPCRAFKGNDTGGIIAYPLAAQMDVRQLAVDHCAYYGKVVKFLSVDPQYGGYISFACRWVPYGAEDRPLHSKY